MLAGFVVSVITTTVPVGIEPSGSLASCVPLLSGFRYTLPVMVAVCGPQPVAALVTPIVAVAEPLIPTPVAVELLIILTISQTSATLALKHICGASLLVRI